MNHDQPMLLGHVVARSERIGQLLEPHVMPLNQFVNQLRLETGRGSAIPYFDPWDGGVNAEVLFLEAPGPKAVFSGFVSRNNPDHTAKNFFEISNSAGIDRKRTAIWNAVPWYIGSGKRIRPATRSDITAGLFYLQRMLELMPELKAIAFVGRKAETVRTSIEQSLPTIQVFRSPHPSPLFVNRARANRDQVLAAMMEISEFLRATGRM